MRGYFRFVLRLMLLLSLPLASAAKDVDVKKYGAKADGRTLDTKAIQKAVDAVHKSGGGKVILSGGVFLTAGIELKSGVELNIKEDATLLASPDIKDFPERTDVRHYDSSKLPRRRNVSVIFADEAENIAITGLGKIDANGNFHIREKKDEGWTGWKYERIHPADESLPRVVFFAGCRNVVVRDVLMTNQPAGWSYWVHDCDSVSFDNCRILADVRYPNNDGIHINCSRDVTVSNCTIETGDDAIVVRANSRSLRENKACERISVSNCTLRSWSSAVRLGWTGDGVMRDCTFSNLIIHDSSNGIGCYLPAMKYIVDSNDYGREATLIENMTFSDIRMDEIYGNPVYFYPLCDRDTLFSAFRNIVFRNVDCRALQFPMVSGCKAGPAENIVFEDCRFEKARLTEFPENVKRHGYVLSVDESKAANTENISYVNTVFSDKPERPSKDYRVCALVWPSCHDDSLGRAANWGEGIGEWEVIRKGNPRFEGHYQPKQPLWGYEMDNDPVVVEKWINTALEYGVNTFVYDWYWFDHYPYLESALNDGFLKAPSNEKMEFFIMWANHDVKHNYWNYHKWKDDESLLWTGTIDPEDWPVIVKRVITQYFGRPNYTKIDGRPVFAIFSAELFIKSFGSEEKAAEAMDYMREEVIKAGFPGLHYMMMNGGGPEYNEKNIERTRRHMCLKPDSWAWYNMGGFDPDYIRHNENALTIRSKWDACMDIPVFPTVSIGWDDTPRFPAKGKDDVTRLNHNPDVFRAYLKLAKRYADARPGQPPFVFINAWNEWVEGSYLLPDKVTGFGYLEAVKSVF